MQRNHRTPEGAELGIELARLCDNSEPAARLRVPELPPRCASCALRAGPHIPNGSPGTLLDVVKCVAESVPFMCHEPHRRDDYCSGWAILMLAKTDLEPVRMPWEFTV